jgi:parvulin-like peptidyl-prolyl isomerase
MSDSKNVQEKWRAEDLREQRKARLASMKAKDGGKKPISDRKPLAWVILSVIIVVALLLTGIWASIRLGFVQRQVTAAVINGQEIKAVELNYYYHLLLNNYGIDPTTTDGQSTLKSASGVEGFPTVADYLKDQACQQVQQEIMLAVRAAENGLSLDAADQKTVDGYIDSAKTEAETAGLDLDNYLISKYGAGISLALLRGIYERYELAGKYVEQKRASLTFSDEEIEKYYKANVDTYDVVDFRVFTINSTADDDDTDVNKTKAMEEARVKANEMLAKITDDTSFKALCIEYAPEADKDAYKTGDKSLQENQYKSDIDTDYTSWLFDASRKAGNKTILEADDGYTILYFSKRGKAETEHIAVRHILVMARKASATTEEIAAAKTKAESLLAGFLAGDKTEASFATLASANSEDTGSVGTGGLYADVAPGVMVDEFNDWCFDATRKPGDTAIVQTDFGFHVMYFVNNIGSEWKINVKSALQSEAYTAYLQEELKKYPYTTKSFGMRFIA